IFRSTLMIVSDSWLKSDQAAKATSFNACLSCITSSNNPHLHFLPNVAVLLKKNIYIQLFTRGRDAPAQSTDHLFLPQQSSHSKTSVKATTRDAHTNNRKALPCQTR